jgi:Beta-propeller repeat/Transmembrane protein 131-like N-terminal
MLLAVALALLGTLLFGANLELCRGTIRALAPVRQVQGAGSHPAGLSKPDQPALKRISQTYGKLPMAFEINQGQADAQVKFLARGAGYTVFLTGDEAVLALKESGGRSKIRNSKRESGQSRSRPSANVQLLTSQRPSVTGGQLKHTMERPTGAANAFANPKPQALSPGLLARNREQATTSAVLRMRLIAANPNPRVSGLEKLPGKSNYFIGDDPKKWWTNVTSYAKVKYADVYPGVDLVYYGNQGHLEYDFVVAPGADPGRIRLALDGGSRVGSRQLTVSTQAWNPKIEDRDSAQVPDSLPPTSRLLRLAANGDLVVKMDGAEVRFHKPVIYQPAGPDSAPAGLSLVTRPASLVEGRYRLTGENQISFEMGSYDRRRPLVIDPVLSYSTYLGGSGYDNGTGIVVDVRGNAYVTGSTASTNFPVTPGAFQSTRQSVSDAFITKLDTSSSSLVYSTYLAGSLGAYGSGIAIDDVGDAYVTGYTSSQDFPTTGGAFDNAYPGGDNSGFVAELNPTGSDLVYSTFLGGGGAGSYNEPAAISLGATGRAYVTGYTTSTTFPTTPGAFQTVSGGGKDAFVSALNHAGSRLVYSSYLGGIDDDLAYAIAVDNTGAAYVTGYTSSRDFPATPGAFQTALQGSVGAFVTKLNSAGSAPVYSTYLSGSTGQGVYAYGLAVDASGDAYITGRTYSADFPISPRAYQNQCGQYCENEGAPYVTEFNPTGSGLIYSTYLGYYGEGYAITLDRSGDTFVTGDTYTADFPTTPDAYQTYCGTNCTLGRDHVGFVSELNDSGSALVYSTYLGRDSDAGTGIALNNYNGDFFVTGYTYPSFFPVTKGAFQTVSGGNADAFVTRFDPSPAVGLTPSSLTFKTQADGTQSQPQTVTLTNIGGRILEIQGISLTGADSSDFIEITSCGASVAPGATCTITVTFAPTVAGNLSASVSIMDNVTGSPQTLALSGTATSSSGVELSPTTLNFPSQALHTGSASQTVTLTNSGTGALTINDIYVTGANGSDFSETNTCGSSVTAGGSCTLSVVFTPQAAGKVGGQIIIDDTAASSPQKVKLSGVGTDLQLTPASLDFGNQTVGTTGPSQTVTLTNKATSGSVTLSGIRTTGADSADFAHTQTCQAIIAAGEICTISITFTPAATGQRTASLLVSVSGGAGPPSVPLSGTGTQ